MVQDKGKLVHAHPANELTEKGFGFESVINRTKAADADGANFSIASDAVPSGKIWKITCVLCWNEDGDITSGVAFNIGVNVNIGRFYGRITSAAQYESIKDDVELYLKADDVITAWFYGVASPETCYLSIFGYEMNAP